MLHLNVLLLEKIKEHISVNPQTFDMVEWFEVEPCGTVGCIGGWAEFLSKRSAPNCLCLDVSLFMVNPDDYDPDLKGVLDSLFYSYPGSYTWGASEQYSTYGWNPWFGETDATVEAACRAIDRAIAWDKARHEATKEDLERLQERLDPPNPETRRADGVSDPHLFERGRRGHG